MTGNEVLGRVFIILTIIFFGLDTPSKFRINSVNEGLYPFWVMCTLVALVVGESLWKLGRLAYQDMKDEEKSQKK